MPEPSRAKIDELHAQYREMIAKYGYMIQGVFDPESTSPVDDFMYTIGRGQTGKGELIVMFKLSHDAINTFIDMIDKGEITMPHEGAAVIFETSDFTIGGKPCRWMLQKANINHGYKYATGAKNLQLVSQPAKDFYQILVPDNNNLLQHEPGFNEAFRQKDLSFPLITLRPLDDIDG